MEVHVFKQVEGVSEKIIACSKKEFLEKGYTDASLRTIAAEAGTTTGSIYSRYGDKEGLVKTSGQVLTHKPQPMPSRRLHGTSWAVILSRCVINSMPNQRQSIHAFCVFCGGFPGGIGFVGVACKGVGTGFGGGNAGYAEPAARPKARESSPFSRISGRPYAPHHLV